MAKKKFDVSALLMNTGGTVVGGVAAGFVSSKVNINPLIKNGGVLALGALLPVLAPKSDLAKAVGAGMVAVAGQKLVGQYVPAIAGVDDSAVGEVFDASMDASVGDEFEDAEI